MNINIFEIFVDLETCDDSMLFDSGTEIARYGLPDDYVSLDVHGDVRVFYGNEMYVRASDMPDELLDLFRTSDYWNRDEDDDYLDVASNNWFAFVHVVDGQMQDDDVVCEDDISAMSADELEDVMMDMFYYFQEIAH